MFDDDNKDDNQQASQAQVAGDDTNDSSTEQVVTPTDPSSSGSSDTEDKVEEKPNDSSPVSEELLAIKRSALQELSPLLDQLDQEPQERFQTTMMMIQAADNKELIPKAYEAAKQIKADKERAQALLDIINEINYFTQTKD